MKHQYFGEMRGKPTLDLVVLSHFDNDHISGIARLLAEYSIDVLLLPHVPLWQRLLAAFEEGVDTHQPEMGFFLNPTAYLRSIGGAAINRIVSVRGDGESVAPDGEAPNSNGQVEGAPWEVAMQTQLIDDSDDALLSVDGTTTGGRSQAAEQMRAGASIRVGNLWEFVPYNDVALSSRVTKSFHDHVALLCERLLAATTAIDRTAALVELKKTYDAQFGRSAIARNIISLFMYAGPIVSPRTGSPIVKVLSIADYFLGAIEWRRWLDRTACLYTGDGYLATPRQLKHLSRHFGSRRLDGVGVLQVMHHGARGNWHNGVAAKLKPAISIFSSDPNHQGFGHPHAEVLRDFLPFGPVQVDKDRRLVVYGNC